MDTATAIAILRHACLHATRDGRAAIERRDYAWATACREAVTTMCWASVGGGSALAFCGGALAV